MKDLEYFKKELIKILDKKEREEKAEIKKSLAFTMDMLIEKSSSGYPVGTIREWKGKKYQKIAPGKWRRKYSSEEKGIRMSIAALKKAIDKCSTSQELLDLVLQNRDRFADDNGRPLPIVKELSEYVSKKNDDLEYISKEGKTQKEYTKELKDLKRRNAEDYNKKRAEHIRQDVELNTVTYNQELLSRKEAEKEISKHKNKLFENKETELKVSYNSEGAGKLISQKAVDKSINNGYSREEHFTIASHITDIFKNANLISVEPDRDSDMNDNVTEVRRYATKFVLNGKEGFALMTVKINKDDTKKMYAIELNYLTKKIELATSGAVKDKSNNVNTHRVDEPRRQTSSKSNIAQNNSPVNKKTTYATDVCKSVEDLANYAKENYGITIKSKDRKGDNTEKILKCFDITERFIKKVPGLEKYVKTIVYGIIDHKTMGYYNQNDRLLKIGEFGEDVTEEQVRTGYYGKMKHTVRHEMTHAIQYMIVEEFLSDKKKEQYEEAFKEHFRAAYYTGKPKDMARIANYCLRKVPGGQDSLAAAFDLFKELEGGYYKAHYAYFVKDLVSEKIVDTALRNLGLDKKRRHFSLAAAVGKNVEDFKGATKEVARISKYALSKDAECMAEAIADALGSGENAAPLSKEIMKVVEDIVGSKNIEMLKSIYAKKKPLFVVKKSLYDEISKGFINRSKLVPKQIQVRSKKGTIYTKTVYVNPNPQQTKKIVRHSDKEEENRRLDSEYFDALKKGDIAKLQQMVKERAEKMGFKDAIPEQGNGYKIRTTRPPKNTKTVYKCFYVDTHGKPSALFVDNNASLPMNVWLNANDTYHFLAENGNEYVPTMGNATNKDAGKTGISVKIPNESVKNELIERGYLPKGSGAKSVTCVAYRPGWHGGDLPFFPQGGKKDVNSNYGNVHRWNQVIFEIEIDADKDYTAEAQSQGKAKNKDGSLNHKKADLQYMPEGGFYQYTTNPTVKQQTGGKGDWFISGSIKIKRALTQKECNDILHAHGMKEQEWEGGEMDLSKLGYTKPDFDAARKTLAPITYDDNGKVIPLSQRFNKDVDDIRKSVKIVVKKSFADNFMNNRSVPTLQKSLGIDNNDFSCTDFVKSIGENFDFETMRKVCII